MLKLVNDHIGKGGYTIDKLKRELNVDDVSDLISDIPHSYEVLS